MTRPSARDMRRTAADLSDQAKPHLSHARDTLVEDVFPKMKATGVDLAVRAAPHVSHARDTLVDDVLPKVKATGAEVLPRVKATAPKVKATGLDLAVKAGLMEAPKKRHPIRTAAIVGALGVGAYAAWNAWRLPHASDDWTQADAAAGNVATDERPDASIPGVPADTTNVAF